MLLNVLGCRLTYQGQAETNAEAWFSVALHPRKNQKAQPRTAASTFTQLLNYECKREESTERPLHMETETAKRCSHCED